MEAKRQRAPGELEVVRAFVNTTDLESRQEQLETAAALGRWLAEHGLAPSSPRVTRRELARALDLREALRAILFSHHDPAPAAPEAWATVNAAAGRARLLLRFDAHGHSGLEPEAEGVDGALGRLVAIVHAASEQGTWQRLKACRLDTCRWAFYDHTKNRSGAWCTMGVCGNRVKARAYRARRRRG